MAYEDRRVFAVESPNMATAVMAINKTETAALLRWIVPQPNGTLFLVFKDDSFVKERWRLHFPDAVVLPH
jgi:hypothetical protein